MAIATWFGCGFVPVAPGTAGAAAAAAMAWFFGFRQWHLALLALAAAGVGVWAANHAAPAFGKDDPGQIVVDEVAGTWLTLAGATALNGTALLAGFVLFRIFDIWKPFPVRHCERLPGGVGIMADDLAAGLYAALVLFSAGCLNLY